MNENKNKIKTDKSLDFVYKKNHFITKMDESVPNLRGRTPLVVAAS